MEKLATELLHEVKTSAQRWFIVAIAELVLIVLLITGFLWYMSLPVEETVTTEQSVEEVSCDTITQTITN